MKHLELLSRTTFLFVLIAALAVPLPAMAQQSETSWPGFRGARGDGTKVASTLAGAGGVSLEIAWKRPIGSGYSGVSVSGDLAVTMFAAGDDDVMAAFDPATGEELWRVVIEPTYPGHDGSFSGPISTPLIAGNSVIGLGARGRLFAVDRLDGEPVWSTDLIEDHGAVKPEYGFATSPLLLDGVVVVEMGAPDAALAGFDPVSGEVLWTVGSDVVASQSPVAMQVGGRSQVVAAGMTELYGIDAATGSILWSAPHGGDGYLGAQSLVPVGAGDDRLFLAFKDQSSTVVAVDPGAGTATPLWEDRSIRNSYAVPVYHDGFVYGFSSRFLTAVDANSGSAAWKSRPPGDGFPILVDGHLIILTKDGSLHIVEATPEEYREKAGIEVFSDLAWVHPSFALGSVFVRSTGEIARVDIRRAAGVTDGVEYVAGLPPEGSDFAAFLAALDGAPDKASAVDAFLADKEFPIIEGRELVHFVYRGEGSDLALAGDMIGSRQEARMHQVDGTDLFYYSAPLRPDTRLTYRFVRDFEEILDPRNPRRTVSDVYGEDMAIADPGQGTEMSWFAMPGWDEPAFLGEPAAGTPRGRVVEEQFDSAILEAPIPMKVYLPPGYEDGDERYPVAYYHGGAEAVSLGRLPQSLDNLIAGGQPPVIAVFIEFMPPPPALPDYSRSFGEELVPFIDAGFRTVDAPSGRASIGAGWMSYNALWVAFTNPELVGRAGSQSLFMLDFMRLMLEPMIPEGDDDGLQVYVDWGAYDLQNPQENWDTRGYSRDFAEYLRGRGYTVSGGEVPDGSGWESWRNRNGAVLGALFGR